jgi:hypothetical protein
VSVQSGADLEKDVFGGTLTEVGQSNTPSGGSPANLNVEFLPGLARTRGGAQPQVNYSGIGGGPWQVRYTKSYGQVPEVQTQLAMLVNPTLNTQGVIANSTTTQIGTVVGYGATLPWSPFAVNPGWAGPFAKSSTQFGREYIAISEGRYGYDLPRQWDGQFYDRVSKWGPGVAPTAVDNTTPYDLLPDGLQQFTCTPASYTQVGNLVTVLIENTLTAFVQSFTNILGYPIAQQPNLAIGIGDQFTIAGASPSGYDITDGSVVAVLYTNEGLLYGFQYISPNSGLATGSGGTLSTGFTVINPIIPSEVPSVPIVGSLITVSTATVSGYVGTWPVRYVPPASTIPGSPVYPVFVYISTNGLGTSTAGSIIPPGQISAGLHQLSVCFIYRNGYITKPAPPSSWSAIGSLQAFITNIPKGPAGVVGRLLIFTPFLTPPATTGTFYSIREATTTATTMQINDNTTTAAVVNFSDSDLISGFNAQYLFGLRVLGPCAGTFPYAARMFYWGELNVMQDFYGTDFNGGWNFGAGTAGSDVPLGWTSDPTNGAGGAAFVNGGVWDDAWQIAGGPLSVQRGMITQTAFQNYLQVPLLTGATSYSVRITALRSDPNIDTSFVNIDLFSPTAGELGSILWNPGLTYSTRIFTFPNLTPATIPSDTLLRVSGLVANGQTVTIDRIEPFPTNQPITYTGAWVSYASDPESIDGVTGLVQPIYSNGEALRTMYTLRDSLYMACDRSSYVTKDVAGSEPAFWTIDPVSSTIGTTGPNAAASGEDWEVKVNRYGLYMYLGREPEKISQEIQTLWNKSGSASQINWTYGYKVWATVDLQNKRVYIGAPINGATECNCIFVMDYNTLDTSEMIAQYPTLRFSPYTGKRVILEQGRKWTQWTFQAPGGGNLPLPCGAFIEQSDGTAEFVFGGGADSNTYFIDPTNRGNDNGQPCNSYYTTHFSPTQDEEQGIPAESGPLRAHMHLLSFLRKYIQGSGQALVFLYTNTLSPYPTNPRRIAAINLKDPGIVDEEITIDDAKGERFALMWQVNSLNSWWQIERFIPVLEQDPNGLTRGTNMQ